MEILIGIHTGTSYAVIDSTKTFTISGVDGLLSKTTLKRVAMLRGTTRYFIIAPPTPNYTLTLDAGVYTVDFTAIPDTPTLLTGDIMEIYCEIGDRQDSIESKIDSVQVSVNALDKVLWQRYVEVSDGAIAFAYINQPVVIDTVTLDVGNITELRSVNAAGVETVIALPSIFNPGMQIKIITDNAVPFTATISGSKTTDSATIVQNTILAANPYPGLPYIGSSIWDAENTKMVIVKGGSAGINIGLYENDGKIIKEFESRFGGLTVFYDRPSAVNTPFYYYIATTTGFISYNKTTKAVTFTSAGGGQCFEYVAALDRVYVTSNSANFYIIDATTNTVVTAPTALVNVQQIKYCSSINKVLAISYTINGTDNAGFYDPITGVVDGALISLTGQNFRYGCLSEDGNSYYARAASNPFQVNKINLTTTAVTTFTPVGAAGNAPLFEVNSYLYLFGVNLNIYKYDASLFSLTDTLPGNLNGTHLLFDGTKVWHNGLATNDVEYFDYNTETFGSPISVNASPRFLTKHPTTGQIYVGCVNTDNGLSIITP